MRRPLVLVGFSYLLTLAAAVFLGTEISFVLFWCCLALFGVTVAVRKTRTALVFPAAFLTAAIAFGSFSWYFHTAVQPPRSLDGKDAKVEGTVCELPYSQYGRWYYVVNLDSVAASGAPQKFKIRLSSQSELDTGPYSRIRCKVHFFRPQGGEGYSAESYYESRGIRMFAYLYDHDQIAVFPPASKPPYFYALLLRRSMLNSVDSMLPQKEAGLIRGMLLGDKAALPSETTADFRTAGVSHLLAVSGLHMATIAQLLFLIFGLFRIPKKRSGPIAAAGIFCFMAVTGFVPSVVRSGIMCLLCLAAPLISRRADPLNSLGTAVLILCLPNPYAAADVGLLLSFFATLGLILFTNPIESWLDSHLNRFRPLHSLMKGIDGILATSASAIFATLPVMILSFGNISLIAPISNLLMLVPASLLISVSAAGAVIGLFAPQSFLLMPFALLSGLLSKYLLFCAHEMAKIPFASISASYGYLFLWLAGSIVLFALAVALHGGKKLAVTSGCLSAVILLTGILSYGYLNRGVMRIAVLDVGTGLSVAVTENGQAVVFGCGGYRSSEITSYLSGRNTQNLDCLHLLTQGRQEAANSSALTGRFSTGTLYAPSESRYDGFVQRAASCSRAVVWQGASEEKSWQNLKMIREDCGENSAVWLQTCNLSFLLLPDGADLSMLPQEWLSPDFLITDLPPAKCRLLRPACTILSMDEQDLCKPPPSGNHILWTGGSGNIVLKLKGDRRLSVGRES